MFVSRSEALVAAKKLLRTFASAPDPRRQARSIYSELAQVGDWSARDREKIDGFGAWLQAAPLADELKPRCERIIAELGGG